MRRRTAQCFTLIELTVALVLLALIASVLYGSLSLAGDTWNRGEAKSQRTSEMRSAQDFLRRSLTAQHPLRFHKVPEQPLYFLGTRFQHTGLPDWPMALAIPVSLALVGLRTVVVILKVARGDLAAKGSGDAPPPGGPHGAPAPAATPATPATPATEERS